MVHAKGLLVILVILAVVHENLTQQSATLNTQVDYRNVEHRSYVENVKLSSYGHQMPQALPETTENQRKSGITETRIIKHPDEKIVHHPSPIYVKRPPTFVTINHPDIIIEPNPVVYHKPAAVVRSPVIYRNLPRKIQYRHVVKHIVKPVEQKVVIEEKQPPRVFTQESCNPRPTTNLVYQQNVRSQREVISGSEEPKGEVMDDNQYIQPLDLSPIYYKQSFPSSFAK